MNSEISRRQFLRAAKDGALYTGGIYKEEGSDENVKAFRCVIGVDDIDKAIADVKAAGGKIIHIIDPAGKDLGEKSNIPGIGMWAKCLDTEGNHFSLLQPDLSGMAAQK